ncbi:MAG: glycosyltransferase family protein [Angustibacter sp.]
MSRTRPGRKLLVLVKRVAGPVARRQGQRALKADKTGPAVQSKAEQLIGHRPVPDGPVARPDLVVATILDDFSQMCFRYEWDQVAFGPGDWWRILSEKHPALLFVESAWNGNGGRWAHHLTKKSGPSHQLRALVDWCRERGIPTVFWNKEDPPNYEKFIQTAAIFDFVFTVDSSKVGDYHRDLGHERVGVLPFAAQPRVHNPYAGGARRDLPVAFAGSYHAEKYAERRAQMDYVLTSAKEFGLHIYSRDLTGRFRFPEHLADAVVGSLPYDRMVAAYARYKVFLNVNSVTGSPTMCPRRLFELSAAQTAVVSAPAAGIEPLFGDAVQIAEDGDSCRKQLAALLHQDELRDRVALRAHRLVYDRHLYAHRVSDVLQAAGLQDAPSVRPSISAVVATNRPHQLGNVLEFMARQRYPNLQLVLVRHGHDGAGSAVDDSAVKEAAKEGGVDVVVVQADSSATLGSCLNLGIDAADGHLIAKMDDDNVYGEHYLSDLERCFLWTDAQVVGKWAHFVHLESSGAVLLRFPESEHQYTRFVQGGTLLMRGDIARSLKFDDLPRGVDTALLKRVKQAGGRVYSGDRFNFVSVRRADTSGHTWTIPDVDLLAGKARVMFYGDPRDHAEV